MLNAITWLASALGFVALLVYSAFALFFFLAIVLGGVSFGTTALVLLLSYRMNVPSGPSDNALGFFLVAPVAISAVLAIAAVVRRLIALLRERSLPSFGREMLDALRRLVTTHLAIQIGLGATSGAAAVLYLEGSRNMDTPQWLIVTLFSIFVGITSATFTSYFMRSLIPWRNEHPFFSDAVAYALSVLLGLIAATYAYIGTDTFTKASDIAAIFYQASVALGTLGATIVGAFIALQKKQHAAGTPPPPPSDR